MTRTTLPLILTTILAALFLCAPQISGHGTGVRAVITEGGFNKKAGRRPD